MITYLRVTAVMSGLLAIAVLIGAIFWNPDFPWITFGIVGAFFFLPFKRILAAIPGVVPDHVKRRIRRRETKKDDHPPSP